MVERRKPKVEKKRLRFPRHMSESSRREDAVVYKDRELDMVHKFCLLGATNEQLAQFLGVTVDTIEWRIRQGREFSIAVKSGRTEADARVAHGLYRRAVGYNMEHVVETHGEGPNGPFTKQVREVIHMAPDVTAAIKWLAARQKNTAWAGAGDEDKATITVRVVGGLPPDAL